jgi:ABC-type uncharacterized transport system permease subunit
MTQDVLLTPSPPADEVERPTVEEEPPAPRGAWLEVLRAGFPVGQQLLAFGVSVVLLVAVLALLGYEPGKITDAMWNGAVGSSVALERSFNQAAPMVLTGTAVWLAYQCGLFNIGADGQLQVGGIVAVALATALPESLPGPLLVLVGLSGAAIAGAVWSSIAAVLRVWRGASEVVATIMLNLIAFRLVDIMISGALRSSTAQFTPQSERVPASTQLEGVVGTPITVALVIALITAGAAVLVVERTTLGLRLRGIGLNEEAAAHAGVPVARFRVLAFTASGALAGVAGGLAIFGLRYMLAPGWAAAWGLSGILIAFLALRTPLLIPLWGVIFGMLASAGPALKAKASVPDSIVMVMQTLPVVVLFVLLVIGRTWLNVRRRRGLRQAAADA